MIWPYEQEHSGFTKQIKHLHQKTDQQKDQIWLYSVI